MTDLASFAPSEIPTPKDQQSEHQQWQFNGKESASKLLFTPILDQRRLATRLEKMQQNSKSQQSADFHTLIKRDQQKNIEMTTRQISDVGMPFSSVFPWSCENFAVSVFLFVSGSFVFAPSLFAEGAASNNAESHSRFLSSEGVRRIPIRKPLEMLPLLGY